MNEGVEAGQCQKINRLEIGATPFHHFGAMGVMVRNKKSRA